MSKYRKAFGAAFGGIAGLITLFTGIPISPEIVAGVSTIVSTGLTYFLKNE